MYIEPKGEPTNVNRILPDGFNCNVPTWYGPSG